MRPGEIPHAAGKNVRRRDDASFHRDCETRARVVLGGEYRYLVPKRSVLQPEKSAPEQRNLVPALTRAAPGRFPAFATDKEAGSL